MPRVLVAGASGNFGRAAAAAFGAAGWDVDAYRRGTDMATAAKGAQLIVNALNPPNYHDWARLLPQITEAALGAARATGARVLLPGNVYVFGDQPGPWRDDTPHRPVSRKGRVRAEIEARYREAATAGVRSTILRAGDFIDDGGAETVLQRITLKPVGRGRIVAMGRPDVPRAYAYLPDLAAAAVGLAALDDRLPDFADLCFAGHRFSVDDLAAQVRQLSGRSIRITAFPWWQLRLAAPFWELARELLEMRYLYDLPHGIVGGRLAALLPGLQTTDFATVVARNLPAEMTKAGLTSAG